MPITFARPAVADLMFRAYTRELHPELFEKLRSLKVHQRGYAFEVTICRAGHLLRFERDGLLLTEAMTEKSVVLNRQGRCCDFVIRGCRTQTITSSPPLQYSISCQLETLAAEEFLLFHDELLHDCHAGEQDRPGELCVRFPSVGRLSPAPISFVRWEAAPQSLLVHAFHTFPDHAAIVKTQSLLEWP